MYCIVSLFTYFPISLFLIRFDSICIICFCFFIFFPMTMKIKTWSWRIRNLNFSFLSFLISLSQIKTLSLFLSFRWSFPISLPYIYFFLSIDTTYLSNQNIFFFPYFFSFYRYFLISFYFIWRHLIHFVKFCSG